MELLVHEVFRSMVSVDLSLQVEFVFWSGGSILRNSLTCRGSVPVLILLASWRDSLSFCRPVEILGFGTCAGASAKTVSDTIYYDSRAGQSRGLF